LGFLGRVVLRVLPVTALTAWVTLRQNIWNDYTVCFGMLLVPMLCLSGRCVALVAAMVPELSQVNDTMAVVIKGQYRQFDRIKSTLRGWLDC